MTTPALSAEERTKWRADALQSLGGPVNPLTASRLITTLDALTEQLRTRVEIARTLVNFPGCKVWKDDVLIFDGVARAALPAEVENAKRQAEAHAAKAERERDLNHRHMRAEAKDHGETKRLLRAAEQERDTLAARLFASQAAYDDLARETGLALDKAWSAKNAAEAQAAALRDGITQLAASLERRAEMADPMDPAFARVIRADAADLRALLARVDAPKPVDAKGAES